MRRLKLRYAATCCLCQAHLPAGTEALWDGASRTATCPPCAEDPTATAASGVAGRSAAEMAARRRDRQRAQREKDIAAHPLLGRLRHALDPPKDTGRSWAKGAVGEEKLGAALDAMGGDLLVLHDRRLPRSKANIDHLVVAPTGVWVIDAKRYAGRVALVDKGGWFRTDHRLHVAGRDQSRLVQGVQRQVLQVELALLPEHGPDLPVRGALCFVDSDWGLFGKPFAVDGVLVTWGQALRQRLAAPGPLDEPARIAVQHTLARSFPPA